MLKLVVNLGYGTINTYGQRKDLSLECIFPLVPPYLRRRTRFRARQRLRYEGVEDILVRRVRQCGQQAP